jgi:hypothetical protein
MSETPSDQEEKVAVPTAPARREIRVVSDESSLSYLFDTARFEQICRLVNATASSSIIPSHLREDKNGPFDLETVKANVFLVFNQAIRWGIDPFASMKESYVARGNLGWSGKLVAALINAKAPLRGRLKKSYSGTPGKDDYTIEISGTLEGDGEPSVTTMNVGYAKTENQLWNKNPRLKLWYSGVIQWAREYVPEIVLGILTDDDLERIQENASERAKPAKAKAVIQKPVFDKAPEDIKATELIDAEKMAEHADNLILQEYLDSLPPEERALKEEELKREAKP